MMKYNKDYWLFIEPYCYINITYNPLQSLIYNTINKICIISTDKKIIELCKNLSKSDNLLVIKIKSETLRDEKVREFINKLRVNFMGDIINVSDSKGKPIQISHQNYISQNLEYQKKEKIEAFRKNKHLLLNKLKVLSIYLNNKNDFLVKSNNSSYQFDSLINEDDNYREIEIGNLLTLVKNNLKELNILGGSIFNYSKLDELLEVLITSSFNKTMFFNSMDVLRNKKQFLGILKHRINANIDIYFKEINEFFNRNIKSFVSYFNLINFRFIIENENQLEDIEKIILKYGLEKYSFAPYYNGKNKSFFNEIVFFDLEQLLEQKVDSSTIIENFNFNSNFYGKLIVFPNLDCYSNLNLKPIGNLKKIDVTEVIYQEIKDRNIWELTRRDVKPCKNCVYNILCPPISNYEISLNKYNLCKIYSGN